MEIFTKLSFLIPYIELYIFVVRLKSIQTFDIIKHFALPYSRRERRRMPVRLSSARACGVVPVWCGSVVWWWWCVVVCGVLWCGVVPVWCAVVWILCGVVPGGGVWCAVVCCGVVVVVLWYAEAGLLTVSTRAMHSC